MMKYYILNAFSLNLLDPTVAAGSIEFTRLPGANAAFASLADVRRGGTKQIVSAVGHADTARLFSQQLGEEIVAARATVAMSVGDMALVGQHVGTRLPEGATQLPEGARIDWFLVQLF